MKRICHRTLVAVLMSLLSSGCPSAPPSVEEDLAEPAATAEPELPTELSVNPELIKSGRITLSVAQPALIAAGQRVPGEVMSAPDGTADVGLLVSGRIATVSVTVGDTVEKGQVLATIESLDVAAARAELARCQVEKELERSRLERQETLEKQGATAQSVIDSARAALRSAEANCAASSSRLTALGAHAGSGSRLSLSAPLSGIIVDSNAILGAAVNPNDRLFRIVAPDHILIIARFPERGAVIPKMGAELAISPRGGSKSDICKAKVEANANVVDPHTRTVLVRLRPDPACTSLRPGSYVEVYPPRGEDAASDKASASDLAQIPTQAIVYVRGRPTVFVAEKTPGSFKARYVSLAESNDELSVVTNGLAPGESVALQGTILLKGEMLREVLGGE